MAGDWKELAKHLGWDKPHVVGISMGGRGGEGVCVGVVAKEQIRSRVM